MGVSAPGGGVRRVSLPHPLDCVPRPAGSCSTHAHVAVPVRPRCGGCAVPVPVPPQPPSVFG